MTVEVAQQLYTIQEFLNLDLPGDENDDDTIQYELIEGEVVGRPKSGTSGEHGEIVSILAQHLRNYIDNNTGQTKLGRVYSGASCNLGQPENSTYVEPDVCFVADGRTPPKFKGAIPVAPDLVIEVNPPSDTTESIHKKIKAYRAAGVRLVWSVYMLDQFVAVFRLNDPDIKFLNLKDDFEGEDVLPGFKLPVQALFR